MRPNNNIRRFDMFFAMDENGKRRPYVVVSQNAIHQKKNIVSVAPLTAAAERKGEYSVEVEVNGRPSFVMLDRITTMDKSRLDRPLPPLDAEKAFAIAAVLNRLFVPENFTPEPLPHRFVLNAVVPFEEDRRYEFKSLTSSHPANVIKNVADEYAVAFLNSEGGRIFWGIGDADRIVLGVKLTAADRDTVRKEVVNKLSGIQPQIDIVELRLSFHPVFANEIPLEDICVVELAVPRGEPATIHFTSGGDAFVRLDGVKQKLKGPQIQQWILGRAKATTEPTLTPAERKRNEILRWKGKTVTLSTMNSGRAAMLVGPVAGISAVTIVDCNEFYVSFSVGGSQRSVPLARIDVSFDDAKGVLDLQERRD